MLVEGKGAPVQRGQAYEEALRRLVAERELSSLSTMVRAYRSRLASSLEQPYSSRRLRRYVRKSRFSLM